MSDLFIYPTASTSAIFVNGIHIEQAYRIDFKESQPKVPIYGYNDYEFNTTARSKGIVQGLLVLNFVFAGYLNAVLEQSTVPFVPTLYNYDLSDHKAVKDNPKFKDNLKQALQTELPPNTDSESRTTRAEYIASLLGKGNAEYTDKVKESLQNVFIGDLENVDDSKKPLTSSLISEHGALSYYGEKGITLDIYYNDPEESSWFTRFENVHLTDVSQQISQAGAEGSSEPLYEIYSWFTSGS